MNPPIIRGVHLGRERSLSAPPVAIDSLDQQLSVLLCVCVYGDVIILTSSVETAAILSYTQSADASCSHSGVQCTGGGGGTHTHTHMLRFMKEVDITINM